MIAFDLGQHGLNAAGVDQIQHRGFHHIIKMMSQRDFAAADGFCVAVQITPAHLGAHKAHVAIHLPHRFKYIRIEEFYRNVQKRAIIRNPPPVFRRIARIHADKAQFKALRAVPLQILHQLRKQHRILPAGYAYGDSIALGHQIVFANARHERAADGFQIGLIQALFDLLPEFHIIPPVRSADSTGRAGTGSTEARPAECCARSCTPMRRSGPCPAPSA